MESERKRHFLRGIVLKDNVLYAPLIQVVKLCRRFPTFTSKQLGDIIEDGMNQLTKDESKLEVIPEVEEKKHWLSSFFGGC